jgi:hypothetical protein
VRAAFVSAAVPSAAGPLQYVLILSRTFSERAKINPTAMTAHGSAEREARVM